MSHFHYCTVNFLLLGLWVFLKTWFSALLGSSFLTLSYLSKLRIFSDCEEGLSRLWTLWSLLLKEKKMGPVVAEDGSGGSLTGLPEDSASTLRKAVVCLKTGEGACARFPVLFFRPPQTQSYFLVCFQLRPFFKPRSLLVNHSFIYNLIQNQTILDWWLLVFKCFKK